MGACLILTFWPEHLRVSLSHVLFCQQLAPVLRKTLGGDLATLLVELLMPPVEYDAYRLQHAVVVSGTVCVWTAVVLTCADVQ